MYELVDAWDREQRRAGLMASTVVRRCDMVRSFARWSDGDLLGATADDVQVFLDAKRTSDGHPIGARTRYTWLSCLGCFYRWAIRHDHATDDPTATIDRPKLRRTLPRPVTDDDLDAALAIATGQIRRWLLLGAFAGLRCAEIAGLHRDDVLVDIGMLRIIGKGGKERLVPIHPDVGDALDTWPSPRSNGHLFLRDTDRAPWPAAGLSRAASVWLHDHGIDATLHQFRHWFGTRTLQACKDIRVVQELMGHASPTTTAIYTAFCNEDGRAAVAALATTGGQRPKVA